MEVIPSQSNVLIVKPLNLNTIGHRVAEKTIEIMRKSEKKKIENERFVKDLRYQAYLQVDPRLERVDPRVFKKLEVL